MPSRKKAKGRARKAKAKEGHLILHNDSVCRHGCEPISKEDICYQFVKQFEVELNAVYSSNNECLRDICNSVIERLEVDTDQFSMIWNKKSIQKELVPLFVCLGTNILLRGSANIDMARTMACVVAITALHALHEFDIGELMASRKSRRCLRDLEDALDYDVIRFFAKRTSCQCLKKMYSRVKSRPTAVCEVCNVEKDRKLLYLCGRCRYFTYCSTICQRIAYSDHKPFCNQHRYTFQ